MPRMFRCAECGTRHFIDPVDAGDGCALCRGNLRPVLETVKETK